MRSRSDFLHPSGSLRLSAQGAVTSDSMAKLVLWLAASFLVTLVCLEPSEATFAQPRAPNFQYFERPQYRYPYYDENGKGRLLYGYGGPQLYQYKTYSALEGIH